MAARGVALIWGRDLPGDNAATAATARHCQEGGSLSPRAARLGRLGRALRGCGLRRPRLGTMKSLRLGRALAIHRVVCRATPSARKGVGGGGLAECQVSQPDDFFTPRLADLLSSREPAAAAGPARSQGRFCLPPLARRGYWPVRPIASLCPPAVLSHVADASRRPGPRGIATDPAAQPQDIANRSCWRPEA